MNELIPEAITLDDSTWIAPRRKGQKRCPRSADYYGDIHPDDLAQAEPIWVRHAQPSDEPTDDCDHASTERCGCFMFCGKRHPDRAERVWVLYA